jgi:hypothetical protein
VVAGDVVGVVVVGTAGVAAGRLALGWVACSPAALGDGLVVVVVAAGASGTPDPAGVGANPIESREIALAARPTATARASPTTLSTAVRNALGFLMTRRCWARWRLAR